MAERSLNMNSNSYCNGLGHYTCVNLQCTLRIIPVQIPTVYRTTWETQRVFSVIGENIVIVYELYRCFVYDLDNKLPDTLYEEFA